MDTTAKKLAKISKDYKTLQAANELIFKENAHLRASLTNQQDWIAQRSEYYMSLRDSMNMLKEQNRQLQTELKRFTEGRI